MTTEEVLSSCGNLELMNLYKVQSIVGREIGKRKRILIDSVTVQKDKYKVCLSHPNNGSYICKKAGYRGRWRMWKMVAGVRGLKCGPVVVEESTGDLDDLKIQIALGYYKNKS